MPTMPLKYLWFEWNFYWRLKDIFQSTYLKYLCIIDYGEKKCSHILSGLRHFSQKDNEKERLNFFLDLNTNTVKNITVANLQMVKMWGNVGVIRKWD